MDRINTARQGFLEKNIAKTEISHTRNAIKDQFKNSHEHLTNYVLPQIILGGQDGLVNVLGVILGIAAATSSTEIVIAAGFAATFAESVSMAAVAYTSKLAEADYYKSEYEREKWEIDHYPQGEKEEVRQLYQSYGFSGRILNQIVEKIVKSKSIWLKVMMEQELKLAPIKRSDAVPAAFIVGTSSFIGSLIPLFPFLFLNLRSAILFSLIISAVTLFSVGFYKAKVTTNSRLIKNGLEILIIGMLSAFIGYLIGSLFKVNLP